MTSYFLRLRENDVRRYIWHIDAKVWLMLSWLWSRSVVYNAMFHSCPLFCISLDRWSVWLLYHPLLWWCYCWWCWWPGGEQSVTLVPSFVSLLYHSALLLSAGWSLVLSTNHWSLPQWLRQNFCCWNITKCNKWYNSNVHPNPYKRNKAYLASQCSQLPNTLWYH